MKKRFRGMTLAAILLSASTSAEADNNEYAFVGDSSQAFVGDVVGDLSVAPASSSSRHLASPINPIQDFDAITVGDLRPTSYHSGGASCDSCDAPSCDGSSCDTYGCDSACGSKNGLGNLLNLCGKDGWIRAEALLMWHAERNSPALVTSAAPGVFPDLPAATVEFGDGLDGGLTGGIRTDIGRYLSDSFGVGGRLIYLFEDGDEYSANGNQNDANGRSLGRPYYFVPTVNPGTAQEDSVLISQLNLFTGSVDAEFGTEFFMTDAYARMTFCHNKSSRLEFLAGYTYASLDDMLYITSQRVDTGNGTLPGEIFTSNYDTENRFNGGQLGFESVVSRGRWTARMLSKVHLGNMEQTVTKLGTTTDLLGNAPQGTQNSSVLIDEEQGTETQDVFTFIPEFDLTIGYRFRDHVSFTAGYMFMYFDNVALAGNQVDRNRDTSTIGANVTPVGYDIVEDSHWIQGLTLGMSIDY